MRKHTKNFIKRASGVILLILFIIFLFRNFNWFLTNWWIFIIAFFAFAWLLKETFGDLLKVLFWLFVIMVGLTLVSAWLNKIAFRGILITDDMMQIILISLYVLFTILNVYYFRKHSELSRLPHVSLTHLVTGNYNLVFVNKSDYLAKNIKINLNFREIKEGLKLKEKILFWIKNRNKEKIDLMIDIIGPGMKARVDIGKIIERVTKSKLHQNNYGGYYYKTEENKNKGKIFLLDVKYIFSSDNYFEAPDWIIDKFYLEFDNRGILQDKKIKKEFGDAIEI